MDTKQFEGFTPGPWRAEGASIKAISHGAWFTVARAETRKFTVAGYTSNALLLAAAPALLAEVERLRGENARFKEAIRRTVRWVGKGIADGGFNCVNPQQAERDMIFAEAALAGGRK